MSRKWGSIPYVVVAGALVLVLMGGAVHGLALWLAAALPRQGVPALAASAALALVGVCAGAAATLGPRRACAAEIAWDRVTLRRDRGLLWLTVALIALVPGIVLVQALAATGIGAVPLSAYTVLLAGGAASAALGQGIIQRRAGGARNAIAAALVTVALVLLVLVRLGVPLLVAVAAPLVAAVVVAAALVHHHWKPSSGGVPRWELIRADAGVRSLVVSASTADATALSAARDLSDPGRRRRLRLGRSRPSWRLGMTMFVRTLPRAAKTVIGLCVLAAGLPAIASTAAVAFVALSVGVVSATMMAGNWMGWFDSPALSHLVAPGISHPAAVTATALLVLPVVGSIAALALGGVLTSGVGAVWWIVLAVLLPVLALFDRVRASIGAQRELTVHSPELGPLPVGAVLLAGGGWLLPLGLAGFAAVGSPALAAVVAGLAIPLRLPRPRGAREWAL